MELSGQKAMKVDIFNKESEAGVVMHYFNSRTQGAEAWGGEPALPTPKENSEVFGKER